MRYYDPALGRFLARDMLSRAVALGKITPEQLRAMGVPWPSNPYAYANNNPMRYTDPLGLAPDEGPFRQHYIVGHKTYDIHPTTGEVRVLRKTGVWSRLHRPDGPTATLVKQMAKQAQTEYAALNAKAIEELYEPARTSPDPAVRARACEVVNKCRDSAISKLLGGSLLDKLGLVVGVYQTGKGIVMTIRDPSLENIGKTTVVGASTVATIAGRLGSKFAARLALPLALVNAVVNDIPDIIEFGTESLGLAADEARIFAAKWKQVETEMELRRMAIEANTHYVEKLLERLERQNETPTPGSMSRQP